MNTPVKKNKHTGGRKKLIDPAIYKYDFRLNSLEKEKFMTLYQKSGKKRYADFIKAMLFDKKITAITFDETIKDSYTELTKLYMHYRSLGVNYNQLVRYINTNTDERRIQFALLQLEKLTLKLVVLSKQAFDLTKYVNAKIDKY